MSRIEMTGWIMKEHGVPDSKWTVISYAGDSKWNCVCECGTEKIITGTTLRNGASKSCGKCREKAPNLIDETGNRYGNLIVLRPDGLSKDKHKKWLCQCDCGNIISVIGKNLRSGSTTSCGCYRAAQRHQFNSIDITGQKFGKLTAIHTIGMDKTHNNIWLCKCDCGNEINVTAHQLSTGNTQSCGCIKSRGEQKIQSILQALHCNFKAQYILPDCIAHIAPCRFDFAIFDINNKLQCLIEYQGIQHYDKTNQWHNDTDEIKQQYCQTHHIPLIEIPYTDVDKLNETYIKEKCNICMEL